MKENNITSLDLFRGIAGYGVAICHFYYYLLNINDFQFYSFFFVEFFFILSGFVLYPQLLKVYKDTRNTKIFYLRRLFRTIPPYLLALILYSILFSKFDKDTLKYLFFVQNISENFINFDYFYVAWSLSIEEFFYLLFPVFLVVFNKKKFTHIIFFFISIIYFIKIIYLIQDFDSEFYRVGTFLRLDSIAFGILTRIYYKKIKNNFINIASLVFISLLIFLFAQDEKNLSSIELFLFILGIQFFSINAILLFINLDKFLSHKILKSFFSLLSKQTYSVYLFHFIILYLMSLNEKLLSANFTIYIYLIILFLFSSLFYYAFEKNIIKNRPNYKYTTDE